MPTSDYESGMTWWGYAEGEESRENVRRELEKRRARGDRYEPVQAPTGKKIARNYWGQAWQRHLEGYADYESRLPRGRSYLKQGNVFNLDIDTGTITAEVVGQSIYEVMVRVRPLEAAQWEEIKKNCAGKVGSLLDVLAGRLSEEVMRTVTDRGHGLFPEAGEIRVQCSCPDHADLCKHGAAVLYATGLRFDEEPATFFRLRGVDPMELMQQASESLTRPAASGNAAFLADGDLSALFGIEIQPEPGLSSDDQ